jgi:glyoxylate reductase
MTRASVYVTRMIPEENVEELRRHFDVEVNPHDHALTRSELKEKITGRAGLITLLTDTIDADVLDAAGRQLRVIANYAVGFNNFDLPAATDRGIVLTNTPGVLDEATATHTMTLLLATARRIAESDKFVRAGHWQGWAPMVFVGLDVDHKTLGIAGAGRIGRKVAQRARGFDMTILYTDLLRDRDFETATGARFVDKETLLRESDFLTLHVPLTAQTRHYIGAEELAAMKKTAVLINASRGPVVDEKALVQALRSGQIWGAGLDVYENEPKLESGLAELANVVIVPHIASATPETRLKMGRIAVGNVIKVLSGQAPDTCVNPEVLRT